MIVTANFLFLDYQLPADVRVYEFVLAGIFAFAGLFKVQVKNFELNGSWVVRSLSFLVGIFLFYIAVTGKSLATPNPYSGPAPAAVIGSTDPCVAAELESNPQCYLSLGHAWNDLGKYDTAISLFEHAEAGIKAQPNQSAMWRSYAYLYRDWGYALLGKGSCHEALDKFKPAKKLFDDNHENAGGATQEGINKAQQCKP